VFFNRNDRNQNKRTFLARHNKYHFQIKQLFMTKEDWKMTRSYVSFKPDTETAIQQY